MTDDFTRYRLGLSNKFMSYPAAKNYPDYKSLGHKCMVGRHLTPEMYERLYKKVTPNGVTVDKVIQCSVDNSGRVIGLIAGDEESYEVFKELFDAVINEKHLGFGPDAKHPEPDLDASKLRGGDFTSEPMVKSCRVRTGRGVKGMCFPPAMSRAERREVERLLVEALAGLGGDLAGTYYPLSGMDKDVEQRLIEDHFLFQKPNGHLMVNSNSVRDWPDARGIWHNNDKTFLVWVNEEDHCRVISMQKDGNLKAVFQRFCRALTEVENCMKAVGSGFMLHPRLGYLCACPSNLGTGLRASVHLQLHKLSKDARFDDIVLGLQLQHRGTGGEHTAAVDDVYDISNRARLQKSELEFLQLLVNGVEKLIAMEKKLEAGESIDDMIPKKA